MNIKEELERPLVKQEASLAQNDRIKLSKKAMEEIRARWYFAEEINDIVCSRSIRKFMLPHLRDGLFQPMYNKLDEAHGDGSLPKEKVDVKVDDDNSIAHRKSK